jgi:hypothetical protein
LLIINGYKLASLKKEKKIVGINMWSRGEKIGFASLIVASIACIAAVIVVPEVRVLFNFGVREIDDARDSQSASTEDEVEEKEITVENKYTCEGNVLTETGGDVGLYIRPIKSAIKIATIRDNTKIFIQSKHDSEGIIWYQIVGREENVAGWIPENNINLSKPCP